MSFSFRIFFKAFFKSCSDFFFHLFGKKDDRALNHRVIVVHGLGVPSAVMAILCLRLRLEGMRVTNFGYNSWRLTIEQAAEQLAEAIRKIQSDAPKDLTPIHFVAHSLGGIVVRAAVSLVSWKNKGRIVFLASPHHGTPAANFWARFLFFIPAIRQLQSHADSPIHKIPLLTDWETGTLSATYDWIVPSSYAMLKGATDHVEVPTFHAMVFQKIVVQRILEFLRFGRFQK